jgi:hypothetical protein
VEVGQRSRPASFSQYTTPEFWADPHIAAKMLEFHLAPLSWPASRPHEFIERSVARCSTAPAGRPHPAGRARRDPW